MEGWQRHAPLVTTFCVNVQKEHLAQARGEIFIEDLRWIPPSLLGGGKRRFAVGESDC